jgi:competence protein ComEA
MSVNIQGTEPDPSAAKWAKIFGRDAGKFSWVSALLLKCAVLGVGLLFVYWAGWPKPSLTIPSIPSIPSVPQTSVGIPNAVLSDSAGYAPGEARNAPFGGKEASQPFHAVADEKNIQRGEVTAFLVDLNEGTSAELEHLPGIGAILAERIVSHRASQGAFRRVEDLVLVPGIGDKRFQQLRPFVEIREPDGGIEKE